MVVFLIVGVVLVLVLFVFRIFRDFLFVVDDV